MAGGDGVGTQAHGVVEERLELDLGVAQHIGVRRAAGLVFAQKRGEDAVFVVGGEVDVLDLDADHVGHGCGIDEVDVATSSIRRRRRLSQFFMKMPTTSWPAA